MNVNRLSESHFGPNKPGGSGWEHSTPTMEQPAASADIHSANWSGQPDREWIQTAWDTIRRQPLAILAGALAAGMILGILIKRR